MLSELNKKYSQGEIYWLIAILMIATFLLFHFKCIWTPSWYCFTISSIGIALVNLWLLSFVFLFAMYYIRHFSKYTMNQNFFDFNISISLGWFLLGLLYWILILFTHWLT